MKKKCLALLSCVFLLVPSISFAIGLGGITTYSGLNQPMDAEVLILSASPGERNKITVSLANNAMFAKYGIKKDDVLTGLRFGIIEKNNRLYIKVSSKKLIAVPYVNFILQVSDGDDVVSREYAIFLDPVGSRNQANMSSNNAASSNSSSNSRAETKTSSTKSSSRNEHAVTFEGKGVKYGPIRKGETLWSIAKHARPSDTITVQTMVDAIKHNNSNYFASGKNSLETGSYIAIPTIKGYPAYAGGYAPLPGASEPANTNKIEPTKPADADKNQEKPAAKPAVDSATNKDVTSNNQLNSDKGIKLTTESEQAKQAATEEQAKQAAATEQAKQDAAAEQAKQAADAEQAKQAAAAEQAKQAAAAEQAKQAAAAEQAKQAAAAEQAKQAAAAEQAKQAAAAEQAKQAAAAEQAKKTTPVAPTQTVATQPKQSIPTNTPTTNTPKTTTPAVAKQKPIHKPIVKHTPPPEPSLMDTVMDNLPYIVGGILAVLALLGLILFGRKKKTDKNEIILHDESDVETLVGNNNNNAKSTSNTSGVPEFDAASFDNFDDDFDTVEATDKKTDSKPVATSVPEFDASSFDDFSEFDLDSAVEPTHTAVAKAADKEITPPKTESHVAHVDTAKTKVTDDFDDFDFDFDDSKTKDGKLNTTISKDLPNEDGSLNFSKDAFMPNTSKPKSNASNLDNLDDEFSFDLDDVEKKISEPVKAVETKVEKIEGDLAGDLGGLNFDDDFQDLDNIFAKSDTSKTKTSKANNFDDLAGIDLNEKHLEAPKKAVPAVTKDNNIKIKPVEDIDYDKLNEALHIPSQESENESRIQMKLDLASSFASISDFDRAKEILQDVFEQGTSAQKDTAQKLLAEINNEKR